MSVNVFGTKGISRGAPSLSPLIGYTSIGVPVTTFTERSRASDYARSLQGVANIGLPIAGNVKQTEIDFGATPVSEASFTIVDTDVSSSSQIIGTVAYEAPTGKDLDELEMDGLDLKFGAGSGQFTLYVRGLDGYLADTFKINYLVG